MSSVQWYVFSIEINKNQGFLLCFMYYAFDVIPYQDSFRIIDVTGTNGGGIDKLRTSYGRPEARIRAQRFVSRLGELAQGKTIIFAQERPRAYFIHGKTKEAEKLYRNNSGWKPLLHWRRDAARFLREARAEEESDGYNLNVEEGKIIERAARELGIDVVFGCYTTIYKNRFHLAYQRRKYDDYDEKSPPIKTSDVGLYVHWGKIRDSKPSFIAKDFPDINLVNAPNLDRTMDCKWYFREFVRQQGIQDAFPRFIPVGMGLANYQQAREFLSQLNSKNDWPVVVLKPSMTWGGWGINMIDSGNIDKLLRKVCVKSSDPDLEDLVENSVVVAEWNEDAEISRCSMMSQNYGCHFSPGWDLWKDLEKKDEKIKGLFEEKGKKISKNKKYHCTPRFFPLFEYASAFLEEFLQPGIVKSRKTGQEHAGYIRVCVFDKQIIIAMWRLQKEPFNGQYQSFVGGDCRTFFEGCSEDVEQRLQKFLAPIIKAFEAEFFRRIHSVSDLFNFRNEYLKGILRAAR